MLKKIIKYTLRALLVVLVVLILVPALLYIPAVQDFVRKRAVGYASRALGMDLSVERLRLSFPLRLSVDNTLLVDKADTLLSCGRLSLDVALWPLVRKEVVIRSFGLERVAARYKDSLAGMDMRLSAGLLSLDAAKADLSANTAGIASLVLSDADVRLDITQAAPKEEADSTAALPWTIGIGKLSVGNLAFGMRTAPAVSELSVRLAEGTVDECRVRLDSQQVSVKSVLLNRGGYSYLTGPAVPGKEKQEAAPVPGGSTPSLPWTVRVGSVVLDDNRAEYGLLNHRPAAGFDPSFIALSTLDLAVDSIYNRGADIALQIRRMAFTERSGLTVSDMTGDIGMDASGISLAGVTLKTPFSRIEANISAGEGILALAPDSPLKAALTADVNTKDLKYLYPALIPPMLDGRIVSLALTAAGTLGDIGKAGLDISSPGHVAFTADGAARNVLDPDRMEASARFEGDFRDMAFLEALLPDSALRRRIAIPDRIRLRGTAGADKGAFSAASTLSTDGGEIALQGQLDTRSEAYEIELRCDSFPLNRFLPADSLGLLDLALQAGGSGFDPLRAQTRGNIRLQGGVPRQGFRRRGAERKPRRRTAFRPPVRPGRGTAAVAAGLGHADRTETGSQAHGQRLRFRPGRAGNLPAENRRVVRAGGRGVRLGRRQLYGPDSPGQHRGQNPAPHRPHPSDEPVVELRHDGDAGQTGIRRPVAGIRLPRARGLAGSGPDAERRHTRTADTGTKRRHGDPETRIARFQPECHGRTRKYPE